ncbi:MAG: hypothetical protein OXU61_06890, partial [Gammaproteobacteria bacterium]|nr:hypothetical protein [Gammaproteobacteria bacterium]
MSSIRARLSVRNGIKCQAWVHWLGRAGWGALRGVPHPSVTQSQGRILPLRNRGQEKRFLRITPPLRGSRQDEGASPKSRRWGEQLKRLLHPTAQENRKGRLPPTAAAG